MRAAREAKETGDEERLRSAAQVHADGIESAQKSTDIDKLRGMRRRLILGRLAE